MTDTYVWGDLDWTRDGFGVYRAQPDGSVTEFRAEIAKGSGGGHTPEQGWRLSTYTHGLLLTHREARTLNDAKAEAERTYRTVEPAARGEG